MRESARKLFEEVARDKFSMDVCFGDIERDLSSLGGEVFRAPMPNCRARAAGPRLCYDSQITMTYGGHDG